MTPEASIQYSWAVEIVRHHFAQGLGQLCAPKFLKKRYQQFKLKNDPIYATLLEGMEDEELSKTFVSFWTVAQTLATQSRFWLEDAVADILILKAHQEGRKTTQIYSQRMLGAGWFAAGKTVAELGESYREHLGDRRPWRPLIKQAAIETIDILVGKQERERVPNRQRRFARNWQHNDGELIQKDKNQLKEVASAVAGESAVDVPLKCNLLVIEPGIHDKGPHAWAFRFVNPKIITSHAARKQERVNLLRLYALLVQEKILRDPAQIHVSLAELLPRESDFEWKDPFPDYFSAHTYWNSTQLWKFIGVPFDVVTTAILQVARDFREQLKLGLRGLLPLS